MADFSVSFKMKHFGKTSVVKKVREDGKEVSELVGELVKDNIATVVADVAVNTVRRHNDLVALKAAIFFQRVVSRTPKDETYYDKRTKVYHKADKDFVWKSWKILYGSKSISAEELGENFFTEDVFNNKVLINKLADIIKTRLMSTRNTAYEDRRTRVRSIRFENNHPRFPMLEYGTYEKADGDISEGPKYSHGLVNHYSVQAPYGMYRITQAEIESMSLQDIENFSFRDYKARMGKLGVSKVPTSSQVKKLRKVMSDKTHLTNKDIEAVAKVFL